MLLTGGLVAGIDPSALYVPCISMLLTGGTS